MLILLTNESIEVNRMDPIKLLLMDLGLHCLSKTFHPKTKQMTFVVAGTLRIRFRTLAVRSKDV